MRSTTKPYDSFCESLYYKGQWISGGAARQVRIAQLGGVDEMIRTLWNNATFAANAADGGKRRQLLKNVA